MCFIPRDGMKLRSIHAMLNSFLFFFIALEKILSRLAGSFPFRKNMAPHSVLLFPMAFLRFLGHTSESWLERESKKDIYLYAYAFMTRQEKQSRKKRHVFPKCAKRLFTKQENRKLKEKTRSGKKDEREQKE